MKKISKKILALVLAVCCIGVFAACAPENADDTIYVGMECDYPPFNWTQVDDANAPAQIQGGGYAGGYDVEIAKRIAEGLGKKLVIVKTEWSGLTPAVTSGKIDMIIAGMSATAERKQTIEFSDNYYTSDLVIVVKKDSPFASAKSIDDFEGAKITGQLSTFHYDVIDQMPGVDKQPALETFSDMTVAVQSGKIDGYVSERPGAISAVTANPELTFVSFEEGRNFEHDLDEVSIAVGLKQGSEYTEQINEILAGISEEERAQLMEDAIKNQPLVAE